MGDNIKMDINGKLCEDILSGLKWIVMDHTSGCVECVGFDDIEPD
jgi:hypothetical protein